MGCFVLGLWLWSLLGFILGATVDPAINNMGAGVGFAALLLTLLWLFDRG